ncbi:MAG TPA: Ig-like domain repeat protein, partial [Gemmataceae bacterium]|nr:Ig-like domain repeat protein [Gemmataceae bacterium]
MRRPNSLPLRLEWLEDRITPAVITVSSTGDTIAIDGLATLREAITSINNQADVNGDVTLNRVGGYASAPGGTPDVINFNIPAAGVQTISATAAEPTIIRPLTINGYSQAGASANTLVNADNAVILIQLDGTGAGTNVNGLTLGAGSGGSTIEGLDVTNFQADANLNGGVGILVQSNGNTIVGNFVGVNPAGTTQQTLFSGDGIRILDASNNMIGSTNPADRNIASGNTLDGIHVEGTLTTPATGNMIQGNFVGVAANGVSRVGVRTFPVPNAAAMGTSSGNFLFGIEISGGDLNTVGGIAAGARNVVGFNGAGIEIDNGGQSNVIQGNFSGVGADGTTPAANLLHGIVLRSSNTFTPPLGPAQPNEPGVSFNLIGGTAAGAGNLVEFNGTAGVAVFGNPVSASGQPNVGNAIEGNSIFENGRNNPSFLLGIDLTNQFKFPPDDGITPNDSKGHGAPNDPNNFQNFPVLTSAVEDGTGKTDITGTLTQSVSPNLTFRIEFFASDPDPAGGIPEGQQFLGSTNVTTDASGKASFSVALNVPVANGRLITATATDPIGNTSEFAAGLTVPTGAVTLTALTASPNPVAAGQSVTFTAKVTPATGPGTPAGMVQFLDGPTLLQTVTLANGSATFSTSFSAAGGHPITAVYLGSPAFAGSTSPTVSLTVNATPVGPSAKTVGAFDPTTATWFLRSANSAGPPDAGQFRFGTVGSIPVSGNWTGAGPAGIGVFDPTTATWFLRNEDSAGAPDAGQFRYGGTGFVPVTGDWQGSGHSGVGVFDPTTATWLLRNEPNAGAPDAGVFRFGVAGGVPVVGDWTGSGHLGIGVFDPATFTWFLRSSVSAGPPDVGTFQYGGIGMRPVAGDWTGAGHAGIGVFDPTTAIFYLRTGPNA